MFFRRILVFLRGRTESSRDHFGVFLCSLNDKEIDAEYSFTASKNAGTTFNFNQEYKFTHTGDLSGYDSFVNREIFFKKDGITSPNSGLSGFSGFKFAEDSLSNYRDPKRPHAVPKKPAAFSFKEATASTFQAPVSFKGSSEHNFKVTCELKIKNEVQAIQKCELDFNEKLFENRSFSDVVLLVDQQKIKAHKTVLAGKSPFFQDLFLNNESEREFEIKDVDHETMEECISFLYRGKLIDLKKNSLKLYLASEKFGLNELQVIAKSSLTKNVDVENVIETLKFAGQKNWGDVLDECFEYISQ
jgi:hypothetical protein